MWENVSFVAKQAEIQLEPLNKSYRGAELFAKNEKMKNHIFAHNFFPRARAPPIMGVSDVQLGPNFPLSSVFS